jgi:hypothetical protein
VDCFDPVFTVMEKEEEAFVVGEEVNFLRDELSQTEKRLEELKK